MRKERTDDQTLRIIKGYLSKKYDEDTGRYMSKVFGRWFFDDADREMKDRVISRLEDVAADPDLYSGQDVDHMIKRIFSQYKQKRQAKKKNVLFTRVMWRVAAVLIPLLMVGAFYLYQTRDVRTIADQWVVANGHTDTRVLPDESRVQINSGSELDIIQDKNQRVALLSGEAFFEVTKQTDRPFIVKTEQLTITVLGTRFNVEAYKDRELSVVRLIEGKVKVATGSGKTFTLEPGERFVHNKTTGTGEVLTIESIENEENWMNGWLVCEDLTMREILNAVERRFDVEFEIESGIELSGTQYLFKFPGEKSIDSVMEALKATARGGEQFDYRIEGKKIKIIPQR